jgi:hypothetical protein
MLAAVEYVHAAYHNAGILVTIADVARESADPQVAETAGRLFENATRLRWYAAKVVPRLYFNLLFPGANHASRQLFDRYDRLTREAIMLGPIRRKKRVGELLPLGATSSLRLPCTCI